MKIEDIMSRDLIIGSINQKVSEIAELMKKYDIGFIPIEQNKHIIGVVTDRDIICSTFSAELDSEAKIERYMTNNVISIDKDDSIENALKVMGQEKVKRLIVSDHEKVVGILSLSDIITTDTDEKKFITELKKIWAIHKNVDSFHTEVDEFYL
ncbi:MAG: CBS domain-containing protein [Bacilli bacterium]|jgi:CBS domain-containing protein|nr:CBS domain-containing protein [Bacilli bacterium]